MKLSLWVIGAIFVLSSAVYWVMSHPNRDKKMVMENDLQKLETQNEVLENKNKHLQKEIHALKTDPRVLERRAREVAPLVKKNEKIYQFETDDDVKEVEVAVIVKPDIITVGGHKSNVNDLSILLKKLKKETKEASFSLTIKDDQIDEAKKKRLEDIINLVNAP